MMAVSRNFIVSSRKVLALVVLVLASGTLLACPRKPPEQPLPGPASPRIVEARKSATVEFPVDGQWHASGFMALPGDRLLFRPVGDARTAGKSAVLVHIGRTVSQLAFTSQLQIVTKSGEIAFRVVPEELGSYAAKTMQVEIVNQRKAAN